MRVLSSQLYVYRTPALPGGQSQKKQPYGCERCGMTWHALASGLAISPLPCLGIFRACNVCCVLLPIVLTRQPCQTYACSPVSNSYHPPSRSSWLPGYCLPGLLAGSSWVQGRLPLLLGLVTGGGADRCVGGGQGTIARLGRAAARLASLPARHPAARHRTVLGARLPSPCSRPALALPSPCPRPALGMPSAPFALAP